MRQSNFHKAPTVAASTTTQAAAIPLATTIAWKRYLLVLALLFGVSFLYHQGFIVHAQQAVAGGTAPNGTIPPGGTIPGPVVDPAQGQVRVLHLAPIATDLNDTAVDICMAVGTPVAGLTGLRYLESSGYIALAPGTYQWSVGTPGCTTLRYQLPPFALAPGSVSTILIVGGANGQPLTSVFVVDVLGEFNQIYLPIIRL
ncbi:MAG TPA: hypothetical protein P5121_11275 [Caldilineaceae bacterium]|nr:hypothetical protein [Caldilineaceae bacterium]